MPESDEVLKSKFNQETSKIPWQELQKFYARGVLIEIKPGMDLIEVAVAIHHDDKIRVQTWLEAGNINPVADQQALQWVETNEMLWAVVVAPWVLVQIISSTTPGVLN